MGDGNHIQGQTEVCLNRAVSRVLSRKRPDDEDLIKEYESSLTEAWKMIDRAYEANWRIESECHLTDTTSELRAHSRTGLCDMFVYVMLEEGRRVRITSPCGKTTKTVGPFALPEK
ncbi:MAG: hypothetical protein WAV09_01955 [Minisyncoccia bacterium]